jgi:hypothetical protein
VTAGVSDRPYAFQAWHDDDETSGLVDFQTPLQAGHSLIQGSPSVIQGDAAAWRSLHLSLRCWAFVGSFDCGAFPAQVIVPRATIGLTDADAPVATVTGGALVAGGVVRGGANLVFHASDAGAGVYRSIVSVDGVEIARRVIDGDGGRCADVEPGNGDPYEFATPQPCPHDVTGEVQLDTAGLSDGTHDVRVAVEDAAGNLDVVHDGTITTHNATDQAPAPAGPGSATPGAGDGTGVGGIAGLANPLAPAAGHAPNGATPAGRSHLALAFRLPDGRTTHHVRSSRTRAWVLVGRLTNGAGHPIAGARLAAAWRAPGHGWVAHTGTRTRADGRFVYRLPAGVTRAVELLYFAYADSRTFTTSNVAREDVVAPQAIHATPRRATGARVVRLSGRVGGGSIPRGGLLVTLQGYQAGWGWRTFRTVRTTRGGSWSTRYRFRLGHGRFGFRAIVPRQGRFPYVTSTSGAVSVIVA